MSTKFGSREVNREMINKIADKRKLKSILQQDRASRTKPLHNLDPKGSGIGGTEYLCSRGSGQN